MQAPSLHARNAEVTASLAILVLAALLAFTISPLQRAHAAPQYFTFPSSPRYTGSWSPGHCCASIVAYRYSMQSYDATGWSNGAAGWTNSPAYISLSVITSGSAPIGLHEYYSQSDGQDGFTTYNSSGSTMLNSDGNLNQAHTSTYSAAKIQAIAVHEFGHAVGLDHNPSWNNYPACNQQSGLGGNPPYPAIMYNSAGNVYDYCGKNTPQNDDIAGIDSLY